MTTFSAKPNDVQRDWYLVDASGKVLGRLAAEIARRAVETVGGVGAMGVEMFLGQMADGLNLVASGVLVKSSCRVIIYRAEYDTAPQAFA